MMEVQKQKNPTIEIIGFIINTLFPPSTEISYEKKVAKLNALLKKQLHVHHLLGLTLRSI
jgi:hypothetical protein